MSEINAQMYHDAIKTCHEFEKKCEALQAENAFLRALAGKMAEALELSQKLPEINPSNYDHDEVCVLNSRVDEVCKVQKDALAAYSKAVGEGEGK